MHVRPASLPAAYCRGPGGAVRCADAVGTMQASIPCMDKRFYGVTVLRFKMLTIIRAF